MLEKRTYSGGKTSVQRRAYTWRFVFFVGYGVLRNDSDRRLNIR
jgi:hypothetical protein